MRDGTVPVSKAVPATSATSGGDVFIYTVWMVDDETRVYAYYRTLNDRDARNTAEDIKGVVTREEVIGDFRRHERLPQAGGTVS